MTGLTTDLGIGLMRVITRTHQINSRENEIRANLIRFIIFVAFTAGAGVSALAYTRMGYSGFIIPCALGLVLFGWSLFRFQQSKTHLALKVTPVTQK